MVKSHNPRGRGGLICRCGHKKIDHLIGKSPTFCSFCGPQCKSFQSANAVSAQAAKDRPEEHQKQEREANG